MPRLLISGLLIFATWLAAADWLSSGGDAARSGWQKEEHELNPGNVAGLKLLWKLPLGSELTGPVILGPIITHRGIKELVIVGGAWDQAYGVDADLGKIFWQTRFEGRIVSTCGGMTAAPVIEPTPGGTPSASDDEPSNLSRKIFFVASDGRLHTLRATDGAELGRPRAFIPPDANATALQAAGDSLYTTTTGDCGPAAVWALNIRRPDEKATQLPGAPSSGVAIGAKVAAAGILSVPTAKVAPLVFGWKGRELVAAAGADGRLLLLEGTRLVFRTDPLQGSIASFATWQDAHGARWICAAMRGRITAFQLTENGDRLTQSWVSRDMAAPDAIGVANGVVFALDGGALLALDAGSGRELFSSGMIGSRGRSSALAIANGHVCFAASQTLFCYGLPIEI